MVTMVDQGEYEERYYRLKELHESAVLKSNEQEDTIRRMNTKLAQIERNLKLKARMDSDGKYPVLEGARNRENEQLIDALYKRNGELQKENSGLNGKVKALAVALGKERKKTARAKLARSHLLNPTSTTGSHKLSSAPFTSRKRPATEHNGFNGSAEGFGQSPTSSSKINRLVSRLKERLESAENQLQYLKQENIQLREGSVKIAANMGSTINSNSEPISTGVDVEEASRLKRALREAEARCSLLQSRLDNLEARGKAQHELHEGSVDQLEEANYQIHVLRKALADVAHERDVAAAKATRTDELEETILSLRSQNRALEEQITHLCEEPFIAGSSDRNPRIQEVKWAEWASRAQVEHLKGVAESNHETILALQKEVVKLRSEKDHHDASLQKLRLQVKASSEKESLLTEKLQLLGVEDGGINIDELERALTFVGRRKANPVDDIDFLELADEEEYTGSGTSLKWKLQQVQVANLAVTRELERAERMLQAQLSINHDLHLELEDLSRKKSDDKRELNGKLADVEALALDRLTTMHRLEAQIKQLIYNAARNDKKRGEHNNTNGHGDSANEKALLKDLAAGGNFTPDENIIEVWIVSAELSDGAIPPESSSFFVIDFFDFESQTTSILSTSSTQYDFAATYKVTMDDFLLKYLGTESLILELNETRGAEFSLVARCHIPLAQLLKSNPRMVLKAEPLFSVGDGRVCGHVHVEISLALPLTELYELFLSRQPEEKARVETAQLAMQTRALSSAADGTAVVSIASSYPDPASITSSSLQLLSPSERDRTHNELEIHIIRCEGLRDRKRGPTDTPPSAYVHYQLLGFQGVFTQVISGSNAPCFTHSSSFPVMTSSRMLRFLHNHELLFTVMDYLEGDGEVVEGNGGDNEGNTGTDCMMGEAKLPLAPLSDGNEAGRGIPINILDKLGQVCGKLFVNVRWRLPLRTKRDLGPNALTENELEDLIGRFSPTKDGQVWWVKFLNHANPPPAVLAGLQRMYTYLDNKRVNEGMTTTDDVFKFFVPSFKIESGGQQHTNTSVSITRDEFISALMCLPSLDAPPEELDALFSEIDYESTGFVSLHDVFLFLEPPGMPTRGLQLRLNARCQEFALREGQPSDVFRRYDAENTGRVSRLQFKEGLRSLGFKLVDEPQLPHITAENWDQKYNSKYKRRGDDTNAERMIPLEQEVLAVEDTPKMATFKSEGENRRLIFEQHLEEVERVTAFRIAALRGRFTTPSNAKGGSTFNPEYDPTFEPSLPPESGPVIMRWLAGEKVLPKSSDHVAVSIIQANYRGYKARMKMAVDRNIQHYQPTNHHSQSSLNHSRGYSSLILEKQGDGVDNDDNGLLACEDALSKCRAKVQGIRAMTDLRPFFANVDRNETGFVNCPQFAIVLRQSKDYTLPPEILRVVLSAFECRAATANHATDCDGNLLEDGDIPSSSIDYRAFISFAEYCPVEVTPAIAYLQKMFLPPSTLDTFARYDTLGHGTISQVDLMDALRKLGYGNLPQEHLPLLAKLFENSHNEINYGNLVQFIGEQPISIKIFELEYSIISHLLDLIKSQGLDLHRALYTINAVAFRNGFSCASDLFAALERFGFKCQSHDKEIRSQFYKYLDPTGIGLSVDNFVAYVEKGKIHAHKYLLPTSAVPLVSVLKLRRRAEATVADASRRFGNAYPLLQMFEHYDWRHERVVGPKTFTRVLKDSGFPFTSSEIASLIHNFSDEGHSVAYKRFFTWASGGKEDEVIDDEKVGDRKQLLHYVDDLLPHRPGNNNHESSTVYDVLQKIHRELYNRNNSEWDREQQSIKKMLERADRHRTGKLSEVQFGRRLGELGLNLTTQDLELLFARFGNPLQYQPFIRELLNVDRAGLDFSPTMRYPSVQLSAFRDNDTEGNLVENRFVNALLKALKHDFSVSNDPLRSLFQMLDTKERQVISASDLRYGLMTLGEDISIKDSKLLFKILGEAAVHGRNEPTQVVEWQKNKGLIKYDDFVEAIKQFQDDDTGGGGEDQYNSLEKHEENGNGGCEFDNYYLKHNNGGVVCETRVHCRLSGLVNQAIERGVDYRDLFERLDDDFSDVISTKDFCAALHDLESNLNNLEVEELESRFGTDSKSTEYLCDPHYHPLERENKLDSKDLNLKRYHHYHHQKQRRIGFAPRYINYIEMLHWAATPSSFMSLSNEKSNANVSWMNRNNSMHEHSNWQIEESFRQMIRQKFDFWLRGKLRKAFKHFDATRSGYITQERFSIGLKRLGFHLSVKQVIWLLRRINLDGSNSIKYPEFVIFVRDPNNRDVTMRFIAGIRKASLTPSEVCMAILNAARLHHRHLSGGAENSINGSSQPKGRCAKDHESLDWNLNSSSCSFSSRAAATARDKAEYYCKSTTESEEPKNRRAMISIRDFEKQLHCIGFNMGKNELRCLCYRFDENEDGLLSVDRIIEFVELETLSPESAAPLDNTGGVDEIIAKIARIVPQRGGLYRNLSISLEKGDEYRNGLCSETTFTRALESSCVAAALHCADIQNLIHAFGGQKRGTIQWQTFLDALRNTYDMNDKQESHVNRPSQQCMVGREGYNSSPSAFHRSSSRGKSPVSLKTSTSYNLNSKSNKGTNNYSDTSFPTDSIRGDNGELVILRLKVRDALDRATKGDDIGHLKDSGGDATHLERKLRRVLRQYESSTAGYLLRMDLIDALEDGLGLAMDNNLSQVLFDKLSVWAVRSSIPLEKNINLLLPFDRHGYYEYDDGPFIGASTPPPSTRLSSNRRPVDVF